MRSKIWRHPPGCRLSLSKKASQSLLRQQQIKSRSFSAGACTWQKIQLRLQVWNLFAYGEQIMRAADCKKLAEKPEGVFRQALAAPTRVPPFLISAFL